MVRSAPLPEYFITVVEGGLRCKISWQSCKNENWTSVAKYLVDDVPNLLKSEDIKDVKMLIGLICQSLPLDFENFIHWVLGVQRAEDEGASISKEEKGRPAIKVAYTLFSRPFKEHASHERMDID